MKLANAVGKRIKELLFKNNITQYKLAKTSCLNFKTLSSLINSKTTDIKLSTVYLCTQVLNISLEEFFASELFNPDNIEI